MTIDVEGEGAAAVAASAANREELLVSPTDNAAPAPAPAGEGSELGVRSPEDEATVFTVLATRARERSTRELALTAVGGVVNAGFVLRQFDIGWLAFAFAAVSAYGVWGLSDRWLRERHEQPLDRVTPREMTIRGMLQIARGVACVGGVVGAIVATVGFLFAALPNWWMSG
jgi:hypothetical protein